MRGVTGGDAGHVSVPDELLVEKRKQGYAKNGRAADARRPVRDACRRPGRRRRAPATTVVRAGGGALTTRSSTASPAGRPRRPHVGPRLGRGAPFFAAARSLARRGVVIVHDLPGDDKFFYRELYPRHLGRPYAGGCDADDGGCAGRARGQADRHPYRLRLRAAVRPPRPLRGMSAPRCRTGVRSESSSGAS